MKNKLSKEIINKNLIVLSAVLLVFFLNLNAFRDFSPTLYSDNAIYSILTQRFSHGDIERAFHIYWQPLYPLLGSFIEAYIGDARLSLFYVSIFFGVMIIVPVFFLTFEITRSKILSLTAGLLTAFHPLLVRAYFSLLTENLYISLLMFSIMFFVLALSSQKRIFYILSGVFFGITYYARNDVLLPFELSLIFLGLLGLTKVFKKKVVFKGIFLTVISFAVLLLPYFYLNINKFGYLNLSAKINVALNMPAYFSIYGDSKTVYAQEVWSIDTPNYDSSYFNKTFNFWKFRESILNDSIGRIKHYYGLIIENETPLNVYIILGSMIISLVYFFKFKPVFLILHFILALYYLLLMPFLPGIDFRYVFWIYPILLILVMSSIAIIAVFFYSKLKIEKRNTVIKMLFLLGASTLYIVITSSLTFVERNTLLLPSEFNSKRQSLDMYKTPGEFIKSLGEKNPRIMTRREAITYYAQGETIYIPSSLDLGGLKDYAKIWEVDYIVANKETFPLDTALWTLVDENKSPDWLQPLKTWDLGIPKTIVYKVRLK